MLQLKELSHKAFHEGFSSEWSKSLRSFWGMWFFFSLISCLRILHSSSKCYVFLYTITSYQLLQLSFPSRKNKIKASEESLPGRTVCVTALSSWAKLAAASKLPSASQQKSSTQHTTCKGSKRGEVPKKLFHRISFSSWKMQLRKLFKL